MNEAALWLAGSRHPGDIGDTIAALTGLLEPLRQTRGGQA